MRNPDWQVVDFPLVQGLDQSTDPKLTPNLLVCENAVFNKNGSIEKRHGSVGITGLDTGRRMPAPKLLATRRDELVAVGNGRLRSLRSDLPASPWATKGYTLAPTHSTEYLWGSYGRKADFGYAVGDHLAVSAWRDPSTGQIVYAITDAQTGSVYLEPTQLAVNGTQPRVIVVGGFIHVYWYDVSSAYIRLKVVRPYDVAGSIASAIVDVTTDVAHQVFDVCPYDDSSAVFVWEKNSDNALWGLFILKSGNVVSLEAEGYTVPVLLHSAGASSVGIDAHNGYIAVHFLTTAVVAGSIRRYLDSYEGAFGSLQRKELSSGTVATRCGVAVSRENVLYEGAVQPVFYGVATVGGLSPVTTISLVPRLGSPAPSSTSTTLRKVVPASAPFSVGGCAVFPLQYQGWLTDVNVFVQATYNMVTEDIEVTPVGRLHAGTAEAAFSSAKPQVSGNPWEEVVRWPAVSKVRGEGTDPLNPVYTMHTAAVTTINFGRAAQWAEQGGNLYIGGLGVNLYTGTKLHEAGFYWFPEINPATDFTEVGAGGGPATGSYTYAILYARTLPSGAIERSTAVPVTITNVASGVHDITIPTYTVTGDPDAYIEVYRTVRNPPPGAALYKVTSDDPATAGTSNGFIPNNTGVSSIVFRDAMTDTDLTSKELFYLNSGEYDNIQAYSPNMMATGRERIWVAGGEVPEGSVLASKVTTFGVAPAFNDSLLITVDPPSGPVTGLAVLDDTLILFKEREIWAVDGDGPTNLGQGAWGIPRRVAPHIGCVNPDSVVVGPMGAMFQAADGIYAVTRDGQVTFVGAAVRDLGRQNIRAAVIDTRHSHVVFVCEEDQALVYNYLFNRWSTWTGHSSWTACRYRGDLVLSHRGTTRSLYPGYTPDVPAEVANIRRAVHTAYSDAGELYSLRIRTGPMSHGARQGHHRVRRMAMLGEYGAGHVVRVNVYYDYEPDPGDTFTFIPRDGTSGSPMEAVWWGEDGWGDGYWGSSGAISNGTRYQFVHRLSRQKFQAVSIEISDILPAAAPGEVYSRPPSNSGYSLSMISLEMADLGGLHRAPVNRKVGA